MTMTWEVTAVDGGRGVDIRADDVPDGISADDHAAGLASSSDEPRRPSRVARGRSGVSHPGRRVTACPPRRRSRCSIPSSWAASRSTPRSCRRSSCTRPWRPGSGSASPRGRRPAQEAAWPPIAAGEHTLVAAPTGSGKTLAGFLMAINRLYLAHARGLPVTGTRVVYVSPLKALAVDIAENLERPLAEIARQGEAARAGRARPHDRGPHRRHHRQRAGGDGPVAAHLRRHHARVALPPRHRDAEPGHAPHRRDRHRRRDPRAGPRQAGEPPLPHARAARPRVRRPAGAGGPVGDAEADRGGRRAPGRHPHRSRRPAATARSSTPGTGGRSTSPSSSPTASSRRWPRRRRWATCSTGSPSTSPATAPPSCSSTPAGWRSGWPTSWASGSATTWSPPTTGASRRTAGCGSRRGSERAS